MFLVLERLRVFSIRVVKRRFIMVIFEIGLFDDLMIFVRQLVIVFLRKLMIRSIMVIIVVILIEFMMWQQSRNSGIVKVVIRIRMQLSGRFFLVLRIVFLVCFFFVVLRFVLMFLVIGFLSLMRFYRLLMIIVLIFMQWILVFYIVQVRLRVFMLVEFIWFVQRGIVMNYVIVLLRNIRNVMLRLIM